MSDEHGNAGFVQVRVRKHVHQLLARYAARLNARLKRRKSFRPSEALSLGDAVENLLLKEYGHERRRTS